MMKKLRIWAALLLIWGLLGGCSGPVTSGESTDPVQSDSMRPSHAHTDPSRETGHIPGDAPDTETVQYENVKAMWLSQFDLSPIYRNGDTQREQEDFTARMGEVLDNVARQGFNTVFLQVRPNADSMYPSQYYPMSAYVVGKTGAEAAYDPVEIIVRLAHDRKLSVHAWINPMRGMTEEELEGVDASYPMRQWLEDLALRGRYMVSVDGRWYLNPAYPEVRELIIGGAREVLSRYAFDGLHMDDYFYPATGESFDREAWEAWGGEQSLGDFRRDQLSLLVAQLYEMTHASGSGRRFGISPAGNLNTVYEKQYADVYRWCSQPGYLDYICPQVYFGLEHGSLDFVKVCRQFQSLILLDGVELIVGMTFGKAFSREDTWAGTGKDEWKDNRDVLARCLQTTAELEKCRGIAVFCYQYFYDPLTGEPVAQTGEERENFQRVLGKLRWTQDADQPANTPYLVRISDPEHPVFSEPGGKQVATVKKAATYTIVEERDMDGVLWGRLKSGAGWIELTGLERA